MRTDRLVTSLLLFAIAASGATAACGRSDTDRVAADSAARAAALATLSSDSAKARASRPTYPALPAPGLGDSSDIPDLNFLRRIIDHEQALIALARATADRSDASADVRDEARQLARAQSAELENMQTISERSLREHHTPTVSRAEESSTERTLAAKGPALDRAYRETVIAHHREGIRMIDAYLPKLSLIQLKSMLQRIRGDQTREIQVLQRKLDGK